MYCVWVGSNVLCGIICTLRRVHTCISGIIQYMLCVSEINIKTSLFLFVIQLQYLNVSVHDLRKLRQQTEGVYLQVREGSRRTRWEFIMGSVNPAGLLLNVGWDTTWGAIFHPTPLSASCAAFSVSCLVSSLSFSLTSFSSICLGVGSKHYFS